MDQWGTGPYSNDNCGPTTVTMAIKWFDKQFKVTKLREVFYKQLKNYRISPNTDLEDVVKIYKQKLSLFEQTGLSATKDELVATELTPTQQVQALISALPAKDKTESKNVSKLSDKTLNTR